MICFTISGCGIDGYNEAEEDDQCYKYYDTSRKSWWDARDHCRRDGGSLAMPKTAASQDVIRRLSTSAGSMRPWIGISDEETDGVYRFVDGSRVETDYFYRNEPNGRSRENCVYAHERRLGKWFDEICTREFHFICQRRRGQFLDASSHLYKRVCPSVRRSVRPLVRM